MTDEMKPCPFCGGGAALQTSRLVRPVHKVMCESCGHQTGLCGADEYAILCWNTRPVEDELRAQIETMQANAAEQMHCKAQTVLGAPCPKDAELERLREAIRRVPIDEIADRLSGGDAKTAWLRATLYELREAAETKR